MKISSIINTTKKIKVRAQFKLAGLFNVLNTIEIYRQNSGFNFIVYSMGKVGSSSIYYSLMKHLPFSRVYHNHFLSPHWLEKVLPGTKFTRDIRLGKSTLSRISSSDRLNLFIITVRDPVARDLSNIIQNYDKKNIDIYNLTPTNLCAIISDEKHNFGRDWFDTEFKGYFGIDIKSVPFDKKLGYSIYDIDKNNRLLIVKLECLDSVFSEAIYKFCGLQIDELYTFNESAEKLEADLYNSLKSVYLLDDVALSELYSQEYLSHFYTYDELKEFSDRWKMER